MKEIIRIEKKSSRTGILYAMPFIMSFNLIQLMKGFWTGEYLTNLCFPWISFIIFDRNISGQPVNYQGNPLEIQTKERLLQELLEKK